MSDNEVSLREYVEALFKEKDKALEKAHGVIETRLAAMNELREQITSERVHLLGREIFDRAMASIEIRIRSLENSRSNLEGRIWMVGGLLLFLQFVLALVSALWLKK